MSAQIFGTPLVPANIRPIDQFISTLTYTNTIYPPYQSISSGSYTVYINQQSDLYLASDNKGTYSNVGYYNYSTVAEMLLGTSYPVFTSGTGGLPYQNKNDNILVYSTRGSPFVLCYGIAWNGSIFVAVGVGSTCIATSFDGITWSPRENGNILNSPYGVAWSGSLWVVVGDQRTFNGNTSNQYTNMSESSPDGITWIPMTFTNLYQVSPNPRKLAYSPLLNLVLSLQSDNQNFSWTSSTGTSFVQSYSNIFINVVSATYFYSIYWSGAYFIMLNPNTATYTGAGDNSAYSSDGINWTTYGTAANSSGLTNYYPAGIIYLPVQNVWICCANGNIVTTNPFSYTTASPPTSGWTATAVTSLPLNSYVQGAGGFSEIINNGTNILIFCRGVTYGIYYVALASYASATWTSIGGALTNGVISAVYAPSITTHVSGGIFTTTSCLAYTTTAGGTGGWALATGAGFTTQVNQVAWNGTNQFVAVGQGTNVIAYSANGQSWTGIAASAATFTTSGNGIVWDSAASLWVASGSGGVNTFLTSPDGINWTPRLFSPGVDGTARGVAYSPALSQWIMVGSGNHSISTSSDGSTWSGVTLKTIFSTSGYGIVWASSLNIWVAGGSGTNTIATSSDGINWTPRTSTFTGQVNGIFWNGALFVAAGSGTYSIASSPDGIIWTGRSATGTPLATGLSVTYSPSLTLWVVYGTLGTSYWATSPDGTIWTGGNNINPIVSGTAIAWSPTLGQFVAGGTGTNSLTTSQDGLIWVGTTQYNTYTGGGFTCVLWSGTIWVAGGVSGSNPAWSNDGVNWNVGTVANTIGEAYAIAFNGSQQRPLFVICGALNIYSIMPSVDGKTWTAGANLGTISCVIWAPYQSIWVAGSRGNYTYTSIDGTTWTQRTQGNSEVRCLAVYRNIILQGGSTTQVYTSSNGYTWTAVGSLIGGLSSITGIGYSPILNIWVAAGTGGTINYSTNNGTTWLAGTPTTLLPIPTSVTWNGTYFIVTGYTGGNAGYYLSVTSTDGINWKPGIGPSSKGGVFILGPPAIRTPIAVIGGAGTNTLSYSLDGGLTWTMNPALLTIFSTACYAVAWNSYIWVAGGAGTNTFASSPDGINWTGRGLTPISTAVYDIIWATSLKLWVAVGAGTNSIATSPNGYNWTGRTLLTLFPTRADKVAWNGAQLLAIGAGVTNYPLAISTDAINWTLIFSSTVIVPSAAGRAAIVWNGVYRNWVVTTNGSTGIFTSPDGFNWTNRKAQTNNGSTLAWNGQSHLAVDTLGASYTSPDGITWTNATTSPLTTNTYRLAWLVSSSLWVLTGLGPTVASGTFYTSASTPNGIAWTPLTSSVAGMSDTSVTQPRGFVYSPSLGLWAGAVGFTTQIATAPTGGAVWTGRGAAVFGTAATGAGGTCVAWSGAYFLMGGTGATARLYYSSDGITWTTGGTGGAAWTRVNALLWHAAQSRWIGAGANGTVSGVLAYSTIANGASGWTVPATGTTTFTGGTTSSANGLAYRASDGLIVAVGTGTTPSATVFAWSSDFGATWNRATTTGITTLGQAVVYASSPAGASSNFVATGSGGSSIATSPDGSNWTARTSVFSTQGWAIAASPTAVVALGAGTNASAVSYDNGVTWTAQAFSNFGTAGLGIGWGSTAGEWVAWAVTGGAGILYSSQDGNNWIQRQPNMTTQTWGAGYQLGGREKTYNLTNTHWTGRTNTQTFKVISAANSS
jgi:frataxin-like iron-binding protein CyaY